MTSPWHKYGGSSATTMVVCSGRRGGLQQGQRKMMHACVCVPKRLLMVWHSAREGGQPSKRQPVANHLPRPTNPKAVLRFDRPRRLSFASSLPPQPPPPPPPPLPQKHALVLHPVAPDHGAAVVPATGSAPGKVQTDQNLARCMRLLLQFITLMLVVLPWYTCTLVAHVYG